MSHHNLYIYVVFWFFFTFCLSFVFDAGRLSCFVFVLLFVKLNCRHSTSFYEIKFHQNFPCDWKICKTIQIQCCPGVLDFLEWFSWDICIDIRNYLLPFANGSTSVDDLTWTAHAPHLECCIVGYCWIQLLLVDRRGVPIVHFRTPRPIDNSDPWQIQGISPFLQSP